MAKKNGELTVKDLIAVAKEFNKVMDLDPALPTNSKSIKKDDLMDEIKKVSKMLNENDKLSNETMTTLKVMGVKLPGEESEGKKKSTQGQESTSSKKKKTEKKVSQMTRAFSVGKVIKEYGLKHDQLAEKADELYAKNGGKSNLPESKMLIRIASQILRGFND